MRFTADQQRAIDYRDGNLQLIACAGSGKTEVVARRVAALLDPAAVPRLLPRNLIAFTFTEKAAAELKERIVSRCQEAHGDISGLADMYVGTIHGFALELLKSEVPEYLRREVLNEVQQVLFVERLSKQSGLSTTLDLEGKPLHRYKDASNYILALSLLRESDRVEAALEGSTLADGLEKYQALLAERGYLDYSEILDAAVGALTNHTLLRESLQRRLCEVIVDEYQDLNPIQEAIVWSLRDLGARLCVVGDDDQTIYQWRGSQVQNILKFAERYTGVRQVRLQENFRSSPGIVETARAFIAQNAERLPKEMQPAGELFYESGDIVALEFPDPQAEAQHIVDAIRALHGVAHLDRGVLRGLAYSDMAILLRVRRTAPPILEALRAAGIRFIVSGMNNLFSTPEAEAARHLFYFLAGRSEKVELRRLWLEADLGLAVNKLDAAIAAAERARELMSQAETGQFKVYNLQRQLFAFLETAGLREEEVPRERGEIAFYNLGKFSQIITDFETIHFRSDPTAKYSTFADFLQYRAESSYPEGWQDNQYANPDAVRIMTVHQAKGLEWPVVFLPALRKNTFPASAGGRGRSVWHILPAAAIEGSERFRGSIEDERRLFYVAMTRAQKYLHMTFSPVPGNQQAQRVSEFLEDVRASKWVKRRPPDYSQRERRSPEPRAGVSNVVFSFSDLKYFFECPYQFKLRVLYGFNAPLDEAIGYGKSLHDALAEVHSRALRGDHATPEEAVDLVATHLRAPYAYPGLKAQLERAAEKVVANYIRDNRQHFDKIEFSEKKIELNLGNGIAVVGRIDLVRRLDTDETTIVDLKSTERAQSERVTETQLHVYALGYRELTGRDADYVGIYNLDQRREKRRSVDGDFIGEVKAVVYEAADDLRRGSLPPRPEGKRCAACDFCRVCSAGVQHATP